MAAPQNRAREVQRLRQKLSRDFARMSRQGASSSPPSASPTPSRPPSPPPASTTPPTPTATPSASQRFRTVAEAEFERVQSEELTSAQRRSIEGISFRTVPSAGQVGGRERGGQTFFRQGPVVTRAIQRGLQAIGIQPREGIRISEKTTELPAAVRHETAHAVLFKAGVPSAQQEKVLGLARTARPGAKGIIDVPLLSLATRVEELMRTDPSAPATKKLKGKLGGSLLARERIRLRDLK